MAIFVAAVTPGLLLIVGLVYDVGGAMRSRQQATAVAEEAARAGAEALSTGGYRQGGTVAVAGVTAETAAEAYLRAAAAGGRVRLSGPAQLSVDVTIHHATQFLGLVGVSSITVTGRATGNLEIAP